MYTQTQRRRDEVRKGEERGGERRKEEKIGERGYEEERKGREKI